MNGQWRCCGSHTLRCLCTYRFYIIVPMEDRGRDVEESIPCRMKLWRRIDLVIDHELQPEDHRMICEQFFKKVTAIKNNSLYTPDLSKDSVFSGMYRQEPFDFYEFCNREECISPLKCAQLKKQSFFLLGYVKNEMLVIESLVDRFIAEENKDQKMCLKELIRKKKSNIMLIENIRGNMAEMVQCAQDAADYFEAMYKVIKNGKQ